MTYSINAWGSNPELNNDDCYYGEDVTDFPAVVKALENKNRYFNDSCVEYIEIDSYGFYALIKNSNFRSERKDLSLEYSESRMQAGMLGGVSAYNDYVGYDSTDYEALPYEDSQAVMAEDDL